MLVSLLSVPKNHSDWEHFFWDNKFQIDAIRQQIQRTTGNILAIVMTSNGSGYTSAPTVVITDTNGTGVGATATATYTVSGGFYSITVKVLTQGAGYIRPVISFTGGGGTGATALAQVKPVVNLKEYVLQPVNEQDTDDFNNFLQNNAQAHDDFNAVLGLQGSDIEELDIKDQNKLQQWIFLQYQELFSASAALKI